MAIQLIIMGAAPNDGKGEPIRNAFAKINANFTELQANVSSAMTAISAKGKANGLAPLNASSQIDDLYLKNSGVTAGTYGSAIAVGSVTIDAKGRVTAASNVNLRAATTAATGIVQLNDATNSTSITQAATANAVKKTYDFAGTMIPAAQKGIANGVASLDATGKIPAIQMSIAVVNDLNSTSTTDPLAAAQGKALSDKVDLKLDKTAINAPGNAPMAACRSWVNFNGQGTVAINSSMNVSSITDRGVGLFTINFITPMPHANYASSALAQRLGNYGDIMVSMMHSNGVSQSTTALPILVCDSGATLQDPIVCTVSTFA